MKTDDEDPIANIVREELVCARCRRGGIQSNCVHLQHLLAPWRDDEKIAAVKKMFGPERMALFLRENAGLITEDGGHFFTEESVEAFMTERIEQKDIIKPHWVLVFVDPNGAGTTTSDEMAIIALFFSGNQLIVSIQSLHQWIPTTCDISFTKNRTKIGVGESASSSQIHVTIHVKKTVTPVLKPIWIENPGCSDFLGKGVWKYPEGKKENEDMSISVWHFRQ